MATTIRMRDVRVGDVVEMEFEEGMSEPMQVLSVGKEPHGPWTRFTFRDPGPERSLPKFVVASFPGHVDAPPNSILKLLSRGVQGGKSC